MTLIFRYTVSGSCSDHGLHVMKTSVQRLRKLYPEAVIYACHNHSTKNLMKMLHHLPVELHDAETCTDLPYQATKEMWKLYPPRLDLLSHEIVMDNDIVLFNRLPEIERFVRGDHSLLLRGVARAYGRYDHLVPQPYAFNSGFYGMQPNLDLKAHMEQIAKNDKVKEWTDYCDDQGIIGYALTSTDFEVIEPTCLLNHFPVYGDALPVGINGLHIIGVNRKKQSAWRTMLYSGLLKLL